MWLVDVVGVIVQHQPAVTVPRRVGGGGLPFCVDVQGHGMWLVDVIGVIVQHQPAVTVPTRVGGGGGEGEGHIYKRLRGGKYDRACSTIVKA